MFKNWAIFSNKYGSTIAGLEKYRRSLMSGGRMHAQFLELANEIEGLNPEYRVCLLCAERKPYIKGRLIDKPNCHRVILAEELCVELNARDREEDIVWQVTHL